MEDKRAEFGTPRTIRPGDETATAQDSPDIAARAVGIYWDLAAKVLPDNPVASPAGALAAHVLARQLVDDSLLGQHFAYIADNGPCVAQQRDAPLLAAGLLVRCCRNLNPGFVVLTEKGLTVYRQLVLQLKDRKG